MKKIRQPLASNFLEFLLITSIGAIAVSTAPYLVVAMIPAAMAMKDKERKKKAHNTFNYLRKRDLIAVESRKGRVYVALTEAGKRHAYAKRLKRMTPSQKTRWDGMWRLLMYDISDVDRMKRDALRSLIQRLGFKHMQHSVWISPYDYRKEVDELKRFFDLSDDECRYIEVKDIGNDAPFFRKFKLRTSRRN